MCVKKVGIFSFLAAFITISNAFALSTSGTPATPSTTTPATPSTTTPATPSTTTPATTATSSPTTSTLKGLFTKSKIFRGLGVLGGGIMVYQGTTGSGPHGWGDVISGVLGGLTAGASVGSVTGPAYPFVIAGTAIVGGAIGGAKFFSESGGDCAYDPVLMGGNTVYTCCNTVFNKGMRWVGPGGKMFCEMPDGSPGVQTCLNGGSTTTDSIWKQDEWSSCQQTSSMWCSGVSAPTDENGVVYIPMLDGLQSKIAEQKASKVQGKPSGSALTEDDLKHVDICWDWNCDTELGYKKSGTTCVYVGADNDGNSNNSGDSTPTTPGTDPYDVFIKRIQAERQRIITECGYAITGNVLLK